MIKSESSAGHKKPRSKSLSRGKVKAILRSLPTRTLLVLWFFLSFSLDKITSQKLLIGKLRQACIMFFLCVYCLATTAYSQTKTLRKQEIRELITALADSVSRNYVDAKIAAAIQQQLKQHLANGDYDKVESGQALSAVLSNQLIALSNDKHFGVDFNAAMAGNVQRRMPVSYNHLSPYNYYFNKMEILPGNIGLLEIDQFVPTDYTGQLIVAAMNFFSNSDALIIDLRKCIGGDPRTVAQLAGYFFQEPVLLHVSYNRAANTQEEFWSTKTSFQATEKGRIAFTSDTLRTVKADYSKLTRIPIYVLISNTTFSSGEAMAYGLQTRQRAKTVGETTGHGGNGIRPFALPHGFQVFIPFVEVVSPVTGKGYQQTGVLPDIAATPAKALDVAYEVALQQLHAQATDEANRKRLAWELRVYQLRTQKNVPDNLQPYAGQFGVRSVVYIDGALYYQREGSTRRLLEPLSNHHFLLDKQTLLEYSPDYQSFRIHQMHGTVVTAERTDVTANVN